MDNGVRVMSVLKPGGQKGIGCTPFEAAEDTPDTEAFMADVIIGQGSCLAKRDTAKIAHKSKPLIAVKGALQPRFMNVSRLPRNPAES